MTTLKFIKKLINAKKKVKQQCPYLPKTLKMIWQAAKWWSVAWAILLCISGCLPAATVYLTKSVVNRLMAVIETNGSWAALQPFLITAGLMAVIILLSEILRGVIKWIRAAQSELIKDHIHQLIHHQALKLDLGFFETPGYYNKLHRARTDAMSRPVALLENIGSLTQNTITLAAMLGILIHYSWWLPLLLLFGTLPALFVVIAHTIRFHQWRMKTTAQVRRTSYYDMIITQRESAAEIRLFSLGTYFQTAFQKLRKKLREESLDLTRKQVISEISAVGAGFLSFGLAMAWILMQAARGLFSLGDLAMFYQAFFQGQRLMRTLLGNVGEVYRNIMFIDNLFEFLSLTPNLRDAQPPRPLPERIQTGIRFDNVSFSYPQNKRLALKGFSLAVSAKKTTAVVGTNGAGKSTLIKLLCRFYDPQKGSIFIDNINLRQVAAAELHRRITVLFQEPVNYHATAAENIRMGNINEHPTFDQIKQAAEEAGADQPILRLPETYETLLGRWFGGTELSLGEWQRLALARAFLRKAELIILDEPTSAMDSWAEADWLERFRHLSAGRTSVVITHRFTTAMQADIIHVMDKGQIVESGTHDELMEMNGLYAVSWQKQTRQIKGRF